MSSYTWICLILNFLQTRNPPILPSLHKKPHLRKADVHGKIKAFDDDIDKLRGFGYQNTETLGELLFHFFRRYGYDFDYERNVVSVRDGKLISKEGKKWNLMQNNRLCVEEPFNTERNLGNTADDTSFRGIHQELRRAFDMVKDAKLDECLEEYIFPTTEEKIWEKPVAKPPPILTRSRSQSQSTQSKRLVQNNRGGGRYNQHGQRGHTQQQQPRRASSAAAQNKFSGSMNGSNGREYLPKENAIQASLDQIQLHNELFTRYQILQAQEEELRRIQTASQIQAQMQAQRSFDDASILPQLTREQAHRLNTNSYTPLTAPTRSAQYFHPFAYPQVSGTPQTNVHTQPSSPSRKHVQLDLRPRVHRSSAAEGNATSNNRSHSQPARALPMGLTIHNAPPLPLSSQAWLQYQHQLRQQQINDLELSQQRYRPAEAQLFQDHRRQPPENNFEDSVAKEYVGYWVNDSPSPRHYQEDPTFATLQQVPAYHDLHPRVRGVPQSFSRLRNSSRSPSPSPALPFRDRSFSVRSVSSAPPQPTQQRYERVQTTSQIPRASGSVLVNALDGWNMPDYSIAVAEGSSHTTTISEATSGSDDRTYDTPASVDAEIAGGPCFENGHGAEEPQPFFRPLTSTENIRPPLNVRNGNYDFTVRYASHQAEEASSQSGTTQPSEKKGGHSGGLGIRFGEHQFNRPSSKAEPASSSEKIRPSVQTSAPKPKPTVEQPLIRVENVPVPVPILSPVREVTTPSPTAKRRPETMQQPQSSIKQPAEKLNLYIPTFAEIMRKKEEEQSSTSRKTSNDVQDAKCSLYSNSSEQPRGRAHPEENLMTQNQHPLVNGWQTQSSKKNKKSRSRPSSGQILPGESVPVGEIERKGG